MRAAAQQGAQLVTLGLAQVDPVTFVDYIDALYFTVTAASTTGFGDIVLLGTRGKLTSIIVVISGIGLLVRLAQSLFRPLKVFFPCPQCALQRHDPDAVHCKACGTLLNIPDDGRL